MRQSESHGKMYSGESKAKGKFMENPEWLMRSVSVCLITIYRHSKGISTHTRTHNIWSLRGSHSTQTDCTREIRYIASTRLWFNGMERESHSRNFAIIVADVPAIRREHILEVSSLAAYSFILSHFLDFLLQDGNNCYRMRPRKTPSKILARSAPTSNGIFFV